MRPLTLWLLLFPAGGLVSALAWRLEIEAHGWAWLAWLGWFHWAVPAGLALFVLSALLVARSRLTRPRLALAGLALALLAAAGHHATEFALFFIFQRTPVPPATPAWVYLALLAGLALIPSIVATALAALGLGPGGLRLLAAQVLWIATMPGLEAAFGAGFVDIIKSGFAVPPLYLALGLLLLPRRPWSRPAPAC